MTITLDDKAVDVFKLYDEMTAAYTKDIEGYKALIDTIAGMIAEKERKLQEIKDKTIELLSISILSRENNPSREIAFPQADKKFNYAGIDVEALIPGKEMESGDAVLEISDARPVEVKSKAKTPPIQAKSAGTARAKKTTGKTRTKKADTSKKSTLPSKKNANKIKDEPQNTSLTKIPKVKKDNAITDINCKYHPDSPALDIGRQLCSSCKWKLTTNGLKKFDTDPAVIAFLKGETTTVPDLGQSMCPVHPAVPSYNQKTGLCKSCQKKAKEIGISDRHLTEEELSVLRNPVL